MRPKSARSYTQTVNKPIVYWDQGREKYLVKTPYAEAFRNKIRICCESASYLGSSIGAWSVSTADLDALKILIEGIFGPDYDFIPKPIEQQRQQNSPTDNSTLNGAAAAALTMFTIGGYDAAKRVYSILIKQYHPDVNPSPDAHAKAVAITTAWRTLKKEFNWS